MAEVSPVVRGQVRSIPFGGHIAAQSASMTRRIIFVVIALLLLAFGYVWYRNWQVNQSLTSGDVFPDNSAASRPAADAPPPTPPSTMNTPAKTTTVYPSADGTV